MVEPVNISVTREAVRDYTLKGLSPREISVLLGISTQRVYVHLQKLEMATPPPKGKK
jgi:hypothetical protein